MNFPHRYFADLAPHVGQSAKLPAHQQMERDFAVLVRRTLRAGDDQSALGRRIFAEARRHGFDALDDQTASRADHDQLIYKVARGLCHRVIAQLCPPPPEASPLRDTLASPPRTVAQLAR